MSGTDLRTTLRELIDAIHSGSEYRLFDAIDSSERSLAAQPTPATVPAAGPAPAPLPVAWLYKCDPDFNGNTWRDNWKATTDQSLATFKAAPHDPVPLCPCTVPAPVPVAERLPGPGDCDAQGRCWWFTPKEGNTEPFRCADWSFYAGWRQKYTHWLPHWALPLPASQPEQA